MDYKFEPLTSSQIDQCASLYVSVFNEAPWNDEWTKETAGKRLTEIFQHPHFYGIGTFDKNEKLLGFILGYSEQWWDARHFHMIEMCMSTEYQGKGLGTTLLQSLEEYCKNVDIPRIYLFTARESQAEAFYEKNGFYTSPQMIMMSKIIK